MIDSSLRASTAERGVGSPILVSPEAFERLQILFLTLSLFLCTLLGFQWLGRMAYPAALIAGFLCLVGLMTSRLLKILIGDFYRQFHYREKFLLFIFHASVVLCPYIFLRLWTYGKPAALSIVGTILLVVLCFQAIDKYFLGRIYAVQFIVVTVAGLSFSTEIQPTYVYAWFGALMLAMRFAHVSSRVEQYAEGMEIELWPTARRGTVSVFVSVIMAALVSYLCIRFLPRFHFNLPTLDGETSPPPLTNFGLIWRAVVLLAGMIGMLLLLKWIDSKLQGKKANFIPGETDVTMLTKLADPDEAVGEVDLLESMSGPRQRIILSFKNFQQQLAQISMGRRVEETVLDYFSRIDETHDPISIDAIHREGTAAFDKACYGPNEPAVSEAADFEQLLADRLSALRASLGRKK